MNKLRLSKADAEPRARVVSLLRVSTDEQAKEGRAGLDRQRTQNEFGARTHNLEVVREVEVIDVSGRHVASDPQFQRIFAELKSGEIDGVLVAEQSRLMRPDKGVDYGLLDHFKDNGRLIFTPTARLDPRISEHWQLLLMGGMMSGRELELIRSRMMGGKQEGRKKGEHPGGAQVLPRGVKYVRTRDPQTGRTISAKWEHDSPDCLRVKKAFELFLDGDSYETIAQKIGGGFSDNGVRCSLMNPIWIGIRRYQYKCDGEERRPISRTTGLPGKPRKAGRRLAEPLDVPIDLSPLVSRETFDRVQKIITERKTKWRKNKKAPRMLLAGLLRCACGKAMYSRVGTPGHGKDSYYCSTRFPKGDGCGRGFEYRADLEAAVGSMIVERLLDKDFLGSVFGKVREMKKPAPAAATHQAVVNNLKRSREKLLDLYTDPESKLSKAEVKQRLQKIDREIAGVERLAPQSAVAKDDDLKHIARWITFAFARFETLAFADRRELLQRVFKWITIDSRAILSITFDGGFLSENANKNAGANSRPRSTASSRISSVEDFTLHFPQPYQIAALAERPS